MKICVRTDFVFFGKFVVWWLVRTVKRRQIEVCFSPDVVHCGWLGSKYQQTDWPYSAWFLVCCCCRCFLLLFWYVCPVSSPDSSFVVFREKKSFVLFVICTQIKINNRGQTLNSRNFLSATFADVKQLHVIVMTLWTQPDMWFNQLPVIKEVNHFNSADHLNHNDSAVHLSSKAYL